MHQSILLLALAFAPLPQAAAQEPARQEAAAPALESLRAGAASAAGPALAPAERAAIASASAPELENLRATDFSLSDREVKIILITAGVVVLLALLV